MLLDSAYLLQEGSCNLPGGGPGAAGGDKKAASTERETAKTRGPPKERDAVGGKASIEYLPDGRSYVKADRQVIFGQDPDSWRVQLEDYINGKIRRGENVQLIAADGDVLTLTEDTAGKVSSPFRGDGTRMSYAEYERKVNAGAHIDELAEVSRSQGKPKDDEGGRHGDFAGRGWDYRNAYFQDFDGKYYQVTISAAINDDGKVVYNIGQMRQRDLPNSTGSSAKGGAQSVEEVSSRDSISETSENVNGEFSQDLDSLEGLRRENQELRERLEEFKGIAQTAQRSAAQAEYWKGQTKMTEPGAISLRQDDVGKLARQLTKEWDSTVAPKDIAKGLTELGEYLLRGEKGTGDIDSHTVWEKAFAIGKQLVQTAQVRANTLYEEYADLRAYVRGADFSISEADCPQHLSIREFLTGVAATFEQ